jgi:hypothetical protein
MILEKKLIDDYDEKLRHITNRIYQILDRLIVEYSSLRVKIGEIEKKLERAEGKFDS